VVVVSRTVLYRPTAPPAHELRIEGVESLGPESPVALEPRVDLDERLRSNAVQAAGPFRPDAREPVIAKHAQVLGDGRLGDSELPPHDGSQLARGPFAVGQQFQHPAPDRIAEDVEGVHVEQKLKRALI
jgi:hypothetical protein